MKVVTSTEKGYFFIQSFDFAEKVEYIYDMETVYGPTKSVTHKVHFNVNSRTYEYYYQRIILGEDDEIEFENGAHSMYMKWEDAYVDNKLHIENKEMKIEEYSSITQKYNGK